LGYYIHIGVGSNVVCSTAIGNARASTRGTDNSDSTLFCVRHRANAKNGSDMSTLSNVETGRGQANPPSVRLAPETIPEAKSSQTGVSVRYVPAPDKNWYVLRASYGREDKAFDYIVADGTYAYIAKRYTRKTVNGKQKKVLETLIPNLFFVYTTADKAEEYVKNTPALSFLTYYYNHFDQDGSGKNPPLTVPCKEMENFIVATCNHSEHLKFVDESQCHFKGGDTVIVIDGPFKGVEGRVARVSGQQRVVLSLSNVGLISTAYIPTAFLREKSEK
ncbi:MAG: UpxY family transcription antiterminator, partial [Prevotella sp.]|nr:UpxY family transcription antiterminator [Prevotella sp.]